MGQELKDAEFHKAIASADNAAVKLHEARKALHQWLKETYKDTSATDDPGPCYGGMLLCTP